MSWFRRRRSRQTPPISLILLLVGFILVAFVFIGFRQLKGAQERRLRLLAGFGERVESTVADLADRFVRIEGVSEPAEGPPGEAQQNEGLSRAELKGGNIERYLAHVRNISLVDLPSGCPDLAQTDREAIEEEVGESIQLWATGRFAWLHYCPADEEWSYLARIDLEGLIQPMIVPGAFDSILLANEQGQTLFQQGEPELRMRDLAPLVQSAMEDERAWVENLLGGQGGAGGQDAAVRELLDLYENRPLELGARTAMVEVEIAGSDHFVFLQPVSPRLEPPAGHGANAPVRWIAAGIISSENLLSAGLTTSPFLLFILVSIVPLGIIAWPFLKLSLITRRQPFHRLDFAALLFASVVGIALAALLVFDLLFLHRLHSTVDLQLADLAAVIEERFKDEVLDARDQLVALNQSDELWPDGNDITDCDGTAEGALVENPSNLGELAPVTYIQQGVTPAADRDEGLALEELGRSASFRFIDDRIGAVVDPSNLSEYPYFDSVFRATWEGRHGCANLPLREHAVLPQVIDDREYFRCARDCDPPPVFLAPDPGSSRRDGAAPGPWSRCPEPVFDQAAEGALPVCLHSLLDRTTGQSVAALALPTPERALAFPVTALVTRLTSVGYPVLPPEYGFAIVEPDGRVLFHSEARRDLSENFLKASDEDPVLRSMLQDRRTGPLGLHYWGEPTRIHVRPLVGLPWSLVTFRSTYDLRIRNFELIYDFLNPFLLYLGFLLLAAIAGWAFLPRRVRRYLWPSARHHHLYRALVWTTIGWMALSLGTFALGPPAGVLWISLLGPVVLLGAAVAATLLRTPVKALWKRLRGGDRVSLLPRDRERTIDRLRRVTETKPPWLPLVFLLTLGVIASAYLVVSQAPVLLVLVAGLGIGLVAALFWHWHSFSGERRQVAYAFALGSVLVVAGLLPALGFFHLARSRQTQLHTQDAQLALARALEDRERGIAEHHGPLEGEGLYDHYRDDLWETRKAYLHAVFETDFHEERPEVTSRPPWPYGIEAEAQHGDQEDPEVQQDAEAQEAEDEERKGKDSQGGWAARLLSARPLPLNDLSARPVESDLSRFDAQEPEWHLGQPRELVLTHRTHKRSGNGFHLASTIPKVESLPGLSPKTALLLLGVLLLAVGPFLLSGFLAERVLLISLVGAPGDTRRQRRTVVRTTAVASTPLPLLLDGVLRTDEVVKQVVLVATLPGPSAWEGLVEEDSERRRSGRPRFRRVSFQEAWQRAGREAQETDGATAEDSASEETSPSRAEEAPGGPPRDRGAPQPRSRTDRFYEELLRRPDGEGGAGGADAPEPQPLLITHFSPALGDAEEAADQVEALRRLTRDDERSVVILAETVPDPALAGEIRGTGSDPAAKRLWTELLASYSLEYGHDSRSHDIEKKLSLLDDQIQKILRERRPPGEYREELRAIQRSLVHIKRECSPNAVLRNVGWSMLEEVQGVLESLDRELQELQKRAPSPADEREMQDPVDQALRRLEAAWGRSARAQAEGEQAKEEEEEREEAARELVEVLRQAHEKGQGPVVLLRRGAISVADDLYLGSELLDRVTRALREVRPDKPPDNGPDGEDQKTDWDEAVSYLESAHRDLWRIELPRRRIARARNLLQLFTREHVVSKVGTEARLHYRYLWSRCTTDEKLVLVQLAQNGLVNPKYFGWVMDLMNRGLVVRDPELRIMNESFARFVRQEVQRSKVLAWQEEEGPSAWSVFKWILPAPLLLVAGFLFVTQRDALSNVTGVIVAAVSLAPIVVNLYGQFQEVNARREAKEEEEDKNGKEKGSK